MGASAAFHLTRRGRRVLGLDRFRPPHSRGAHSGGSRIIRLAYAEGAEYVPFLHRAYDLWRELGEESGVELVTHTGGLMLGKADSPTLVGALASARTYGLDHELLDAGQVQRRFPAFTPSDAEAALYDDAAGVIRPEAAIETYLKLAVEAGAELRFGVTVNGWTAGPDGVSVDTSIGKRSADALVLCAGAWAPQLLADLSLPLRVERRVQHYFRSPGPAFALERFPIW